MKIRIEKIKTFGRGIEAFRIVPEKKQKTAVDKIKPEQLPVEITANAARLGERLRAMVPKKNVM